MSPDIPISSSPVVFRHSSRRVRRKELREFFNDLVKRALRGAAVTCLITGDRELSRLNGQFRGKKHATDVLSFPSTEGPGGEIAISLDRALAQAAELGHEPQDEVRVLMLHGVLHLSGLDHETDSGEMARAETRWRKRLGLPAGLIERNGR